MTTETDLFQLFLQHPPLLREIEAGEVTPHHEVTIRRDGQQTSVDLVLVRNEKPAGGIVMLEGKKSLTMGLVNQCERLIGMADFIFAVVWHPGRRSDAHNARRERLIASGIGLLYIEEWGRVEYAIQAKWLTVVHREAVLSSMTDAQCPSSGGPPAGSAGAKRIRPDRWDELRRYIAEMNSAGLSCTMQHIRGMLADKYTADDLRLFSNEVRKGRVRGVRCRGKGTTYETTGSWANERA